MTPNPSYMDSSLRGLNDQLRVSGAKRSAFEQTFRYHTAHTSRVNICY
jgi:hypothetical protein